MKLKHLESSIQEICNIRNFGGSPNIDLEQYSTPPRLAAELMLEIQEDIQDQVVVDLGCGCGVLSAGAGLLEAAVVTAVDIDPNCLEITSANLSEVEVPVDLVRADVNNLKLKADTVITNPPFGTRNPGADWNFVEAGLRIAPVVYSFHKTSTRKGLMKKIHNLGGRGEVVSSVNFELPKSYKMHKHKSLSVQVDIWKFCLTQEL